MRKIILFALLMIFSIGVATAQTQIKYKQQGTNFVQSSTKDKSATAEKTTFTWEIKGVKYPIYLTNRGAVYIVRKSRKTGKEYKQYLPKEVAEKIVNSKNK